MLKKNGFSQVLITLFLGMLLSLGAVAQSTNSLLIWKQSIEPTGQNRYQLRLSAALPADWVVYAANADMELSGPTIKSNESSIELGKAVVVGKLESRIDPVFEQAKLGIYRDSIQITVPVKRSRGDVSAFKLMVYTELENKLQFQTDESTLRINLEEMQEVRARQILIPSIDINHPLTNAGADAGGSSTDARSMNLLNLFFLGFVGGLIALLTPCVFPMIPLTVSFFTKKSSSRKSGIRNAFLYGFFIFFIYVCLSLPFHFLDQVNPELLNNISTNAYLNLFFFFIFLFFAFSFFGYYEITLPASFSTGVDSKAGMGNVFGIFFMALTLALVSFSCTGPILGSLLAGSLASDGGAMQLTVGMGGFGLALALPFALFALFPHWLQSLPKSGGWLNTVKVTLGFLELALALKFLSNADLVKHWGILKREVFIGIWILIGAGLTLYLFGKLRFKNDYAGQPISTARKITASLVALFTLYLIPGVSNTSYANLKLISGFPPPLYYSVYAQASDCILGLHCTRDYEEGLALARQENKPLLIDFTGYACVNCRRMEENVWSDPEIHQLMKDNFIVVSLYVDDKKELPVNEQFEYTSKDGVKKEMVSYGDLWSSFETENFANNAQPLYAVLNTDQQLLAHPVGYTPDKKTYLNWLKASLKAFKP